MQIAADNNDLNEETLDGKNTTHATTSQRRQFGPVPQSTAMADHGTRRRSLQASGSVYEIQQCPAHGRRPVVTEYVNSIDKEWYNGQCATYSTASNNDVTWALLRLNPSSLVQTTTTVPAANQPVPSWSGFNSILFPEIPCASNIGYCPMIDGSSTESSTVYTVMTHAQKMSSSLGQEDCVTFDLAIYAKAKQIQLKFPDRRIFRHCDKTWWLSHRIKFPVDAWKEVSEFRPRGSSDRVWCVCDCHNIHPDEKQVKQQRRPCAQADCFVCYGIPLYNGIALIMEMISEPMKTS